MTKKFLISFLDQSSYNTFINIINRQADFTISVIRKNAMSVIVECTGHVLNKIKKLSEDDDFKFGAVFSNPLDL